MTRSLRELLHDPASGLVLDAVAWRNRNENAPSSKPAFFRTTAGHYQSQFVAFLQLFKLPAECELVLDDLAAAARDLKTAFGFNAVVACSAPSKMLLDRLHARLESTPDELETFYFGNFPFLNPENQGLIELSGRKILILTDVIASGSTVRNLCHLVRQRKGEPVAILAAVLTEPGFRDQGHIDNLTLRYRNFLEVTRLEPVDLPAEFHEIDIDPLTMMPKSERYSTNSHHSLISPHVALEHFRDSQSLRTGFYQRDGRRFTSAVRFDKLRQYRDKHDESTLRQSCRPFIEMLATASCQSRWTLVTTLNEDDIALATFIESELPANFKPTRILYVSRTDSIQFQRRYFLPFPDAVTVEDQHILLLLSSCNTGDKVTNLASLLASHHAKHIQVLCLINRLGPDTADFVKRVTSLIDGSPESEIRFSFQSIYDLPDFSQTELSQLVLTIDNLATHYLALTRVPSFRRWMHHEQKYFAFHGLTGWRFLGDFPSANGSQRPPGQKDFEDDLKLFSAQRELFAERQSAHSTSEATSNGKRTNTFDGAKFLPLIDLLGSPPESNKPFDPSSIADKGTLYKLYALFLSQIHLLKLTRYFAILRARLITLVRALRVHRFDLEASLTGASTIESTDDIRNCITREVQLWFGLALLALNDDDTYLDQPSYTDLIRELLTCDRQQPAEWNRTPRNLAYYFSEDIVMWACSLLLVFSAHDKHAITALVKDYRDYFWEVFPDDDAPALAAADAKHPAALDISFLSPFAPVSYPLETTVRRTQVRFRIRNNLDLLLTELGVHKTTQNHEIIRFLQRRLIYTRKDHNPITSAVNQALAAIRKDLGVHSAIVTDINNDVASHPSQNYTPVSVPFGPTRRHLQSALEDAIYASGALEEITQVLPEFFRFTSAKHEDIQDYVDPQRPTSFPNDVQRLALIFDRMRRDGRISLADYRDIEWAWKRCQNVMYSDHSTLRQALLNYIVLFDGSVPSQGSETFSDSARDDEPTRGFGLLKHAVELAKTTLERKAALEKQKQVDTEKQEENSRRLLSYVRAIDESASDYVIPPGPRFVLAEYWLVVEVLKNLFTNIRHSFVDMPVDRMPSKPIRVDVDDTLKPGVIVTTIRCFGSPFPESALPKSGRSTTLFRHRTDIEQYGGNLDWGNLPNGSGSWVRLELLSRRNPHRDGRRYE